jgi:superfamily II RNA helicase
MSYLRIVKPNEPCTTMPATFAAEFKFPLDPFQQHAVAAISRDENVLVTAKTGSGKTLVGEAQIAHSLSKGRRVFYTTPIKSLSNQKFHDLKGMFPDRVGIMTGDIKFKPDADVVIMTTEILRNLLFKRNSATRTLGITADLSLDGLDAVVFDECHYINDRDRGAVWEETMILLPPEVSLVLLSATIDKPELFAEWLGALKQKPIHLISTQYRIVPLQHAVYRGDELLTVMDNKEVFDSGIYKSWTLSRLAQQKGAADHKAAVANRRRGGYEDAAIARTASVKSFTHQLNELIGRLDSKTLLPALFFVFSRKDCERYAAKVEHTLLDSSDTAAVKHIIDFHLHRYGEGLLRLQQYVGLRSLLEKGIAFHHSGLLPVLKEIVEILFGRGYVKVLFATETFAVGINMPTKTVVFTGYRKYDDAKDGMRILNTDEYIQMAGRAGRRGKDDKGLVLYLPDREPEEVDDVRRMMTGAKATFQSRMTFHYDFLLKTMQSGNLRWIDLMKQSYWYRRHEEAVKGLRKELKRLEADRVAVEISGAEREAMQEGDEIRARLQQSVNAAKRAAQQAWDAWDRQHAGPRWYSLQKEIWPWVKRLDGEIARAERDIEAAEAPEADVQPSLAAMTAMGLLDASGALTPLGTAATEINEGHAILMSKLYMSGVMAEAGAEEILATLACFLGEGGSASPPDTLRVPQRIINTLYVVDGIAKDCCAAERRVGAPAPPTNTFWDLSTTWIEPVWRWIKDEEESVAQLCEDYGFFEGNFMRTLLKMANILEEWRSVATLAADTSMLERLVGLEQRLLRGVAVCDSLYLRI